MKIKTVLKNLFPLFLSLLLMGAAVHPLFAVEKPSLSMDLVVKINRLDHALNLIDSLFKAADPDGGVSPTAVLRGMIQGTDWVDFSRLIVIGIDIAEPQPIMVALVPFIKPNENFKKTYNASAGPDYYILPLPPGQVHSIGPFKDAMVNLSKSKSKPAISVEIALGNLIQKSGPKIRQALSQMGNLTAAAEPEKIPFSPMETREMLEKILDNASQIETLSVNVDLNKAELAYEVIANARDGSELAQLFLKENSPGYLNRYNPRLQMNFRSRRFDAEKMLSLIGEVFGKVYEGIGVDLNQLVMIGSKFSGEMAGGMSLSQSGWIFEMVHVLKEGYRGQEFIESEYIPWMLAFGRNMQSIIETQTGKKPDPFFVRTKDSTVEGFRVVGVKTQIPVLTDTADIPPPKLLKSMTAYEFRMTAIDSLVLTASTDDRLASLIKTAKGLKKEASRGPLMMMDYDLASYINVIKEMIPGFPGEEHPVPRLGKINVVIDADKGRSRLRSSMKTEDVYTLIAYLKGMSISEIQGKKGIQPAEKRAVEDKETIRIMEKGTLSSLTGDFKGAAVSFETVIEKYPKNSDAHFYRGLAYQEMENLPEALSSLNRAIELNPEKGVYYYGRGRAYLVSGEKEKAITDFKRAAVLGNEDARRYLKETAKVRWE
ncbi:MAG: tetratricopeptide repeat protein [Pseudomonadota bacterium]